MSDIATILNLINETKEESKYDCFIPSIGKKISLFPLNAQHQKEFVKALVDSPYYSTIFNIKLTEILKNIIPATNEIDVGKLNVFDKTLLTLKIRSENITDTITSTHKDEDGKEFTKNYSLKSHLTKLGEIECPQSKTLEIDDYTLVLDYPTIDSEYEFEKYTESILSKIENTPKALKGVISNIYILNVLKYVKTLKIKDTEIDFNQLTVSEKVNIGYKLSVKITRAIIDVIDSHFGDGIMKLLTYNFIHNKKQYSNTITISNTFFME
jgi:hypothetical protein